MTSPCPLPAPSFVDQKIGAADHLGEVRKAWVTAIRIAGVISYALRGRSTIGFVEKPRDRQVGGDMPGRVVGASADGG
jgi:hypothetical protein